MGVFNSWDTFDTNSCLDWSTAFNAFSVLFTASDILIVSLQDVSEKSSSRFPSATRFNEDTIDSNGRIKTTAAAALRIRTVTNMISSYRADLLLNFSSSINILSVEAVTTITPAVFPGVFPSSVWTFSAMGIVRRK